MDQDSPVTISAEDRRTIAAILDYIASDTEGIAVNEATVCNFCGREVEQDDLDETWTIGHDAECLFMHARRLLAQLGW